MNSSVLCAAVSLLALSATAATFRFGSDPFAGSNAADPGRQIVGGEPFISFDPATDIFSFNQGVFGVGGTVMFANDEVDNLPMSGVNVIVLRTFDNDDDPATPFGAGTAANLIAGQITDPGPGFFVYFNSGLNLPRLVFSTDLSENTADLKILARVTNLTGEAGRDALAGFTAANFEITAIPEPSTFGLMTAGALLLCGYTLRRRRARGCS